MRDVHRNGGLMNTHPEIWNKLREILADILGVEDIDLQPETTAKNIPGWDSISHIQIMISIEKAFSFRFRTGELSQLENVGQLVERIGRRVAGNE